MFAKRSDQAAPEVAADPNHVAAPARAMDPPVGSDPVVVEPAAEAPTGPAATRATAPTRASRTWVTLGVAMFLLIVVLVFILENLQNVRVSFFGLTWRIPLAVDLLLATVLGALIMLAAGSTRIIQLRRAARQVEGRQRAHHAD